MERGGDQERGRETGGKNGRLFRSPCRPLSLSPPLLVLIGYRGTGKSSVARLLAAALQWESFDADIEIERQAGKSIRRIFAEDGEPRFRDWESQVVAELATRRQAVLALGGGAVLRESNRQALTEATVVWLTADAQTLHARITADLATSERRPHLTAVGGKDEIDQLLQQRDPIYRCCADYTVDTVSKTPHQVAEEIVCLVKND